MSKLLITLCMTLLIFSAARAERADDVEARNDNKDNGRKLSSTEKLFQMLKTGERPPRRPTDFTLQPAFESKPQEIKDCEKSITEAQLMASAKIFQAIDQYLSTYTQTKMMETTIPYLQTISNNRHELEYRDEMTVEEIQLNTDIHNMTIKCDEKIGKAVYDAVTRIFENLAAW